MHSLFFTLLDSSLVLAGHGYDFRGSPSGDSGGGDNGGGLSMEWIVAVLLLALVTVAVLMWLNRREEGPGDGDGARAMKLKSVAPLAFTVAVIAAPLVVWTTSSGGDEKSLTVERWTSPTGARELLVSLGDDDLNTLKTTNGRKTVRLECRGRQGQAVLDARQKWPFIRETGYKYPHAHQAATSEQIQRADRCRLSGIGKRLEADVEGALTG
jgi:hypothetical protein